VAKPQLSTSRRLERVALLTHEDESESIS